MHKKIFLGVAALLSFQLCQVANAQESDVYVDLTALDAIGYNDFSEVSVSQPLFPVYQKTEKPKAAKAAKKAKPAAKKKTQAKKVKVEVVKKQPAEVKQPQAAEVVVVDVEPSAQPQSHKEVIYAEVEEVAKTPAAAEPQPKTEEKVEVVAVEPSAQKAPVEISATVVEDEIPAAIEMPVTKNEAPAAAEPQANPAPAAEIAPKPLIPAAVATPAAAVQNGEMGQIKFAADVSELTDEQQAKLDAIVSGFSNPSANKIAIYAYNLDDGVDTFKKKRLCLNRAVEVRSYLLQKGYKNFSIKVINVDGKSDKADVVELEELK